METLQDLYSQMAKDNIIDNAAFLESMMELYKNSSRPCADISNITEAKKYHRVSDFYNYLTEGKNNQRNNSQVNQEDYKSFYIKMTNRWISNILSLNEQQLNSLSLRGYTGYSVIRRILQGIPQVNSMDEIEDLYNKIIKALGIYGLDFEKSHYFWRSLQKTNGFTPMGDYRGDFTHIDSAYGKARQEEREEVEYRLYINCADEDIFKIVNAYVEYCEKNGIHYYFKYYPGSKKQDKLLIYSSKEQLKNNIDILRQIGKDYPEIITNCGPKIELAGNIDNWIGIASEPDEDVMKYRQSFNTLRAEILEDAAERTVLDFIKNNIKRQDVRNELINRAVEVIIKKMQKSNGEIPKELYTSEYISRLKRAITSIIPGTNIPYIIYGFMRIEEVIPQKNELFKTNEEALFKLRLPDGREFAYSISVADSILKSMVDIMKQIDPNYLEKYRAEIKKACPKYAVDPNNFSLNISSLEDFKQLDDLETTLILDESDKNKEHTEKQSNWNINNYYYVRGILSTLSPEDLTIRIPNSGFSFVNDLSLEQFAEEYLVSRMDENQNFIDENGEAIPVYELIRDLVKQYSDQQEYKY